MKHKHGVTDVGLEDYVRVVRCKDCKYSFDLNRGILGCDYFDGEYPHSEDYAEFSPEDFCSRGERKESEE